MRRALTVLTAALLTLAGATTQTPAVADPAATVYVDPANGGLDGGDCAGSARACATIGYALTQVAADGTVVVEAASYDEAVTLTQPVTLVGHDAEIDSLDIGASGGAVEVSGFTITGSASPLVAVHDAVATDSIAVHDNTITGTTDPQTGVTIAGNAAPVSLTGNRIDAASDGIAITGNDQTPTYTVRDNTFGISSGAGAAVALTAPSTLDSLDVTLGGNTGTISATGQTVTESGDGPISITSTGTPNTLAAASSAVTAADAPSAITTLEDPRSFTSALTSGSALAHARLDVTVVATNGTSADQIQLGYNTDGGTTYKPVTLTGDNGNYEAAVTQLDDFAAATSTPIHFQLAAGDSSPAATLTITLSLDEVAGGSMVNTVAATTFPVAVHVNSAPTADPQPSASVARNGSVAITLAASDADADPITAWANTNPAHGVLTGAAPDLTYTPATSYSGPDSFTFTASDGKGGTSAPATVSITVSSDNAPVAGDFTLDTTVEHGSSGVPIQLSPHASDTDNDPLTFSVSPTSQHGGTVTVTGQGAATYVPAPGYGGPDSFTYSVNDGTTDSSPPGTVTLTVDTPPVVPNPTATVEHNNASATTHSVPLDMTASDLDGDPLTYTVVSGPAAGTLARTDSQFTYTPGVGFVGTDSFVVRVNDDHGGISTGTATITVTDQTPTISGPDGTVRINYDAAPTVIDITTDDPDQGDLATIKAVKPDAGKGNVTVSPDGRTVSYAPTAGATGNDTFGLATTDGNQQSRSIIVSVVIDKANASISSVTVTPRIPTSAQHPTVTVAVASAGNTTKGKVAVHLGTAAYSAAVSNGKAVVHLPALAGGKHTISVTFGGTTTTRAVTKAVSTTFSVSRVASTISFTTSPLQLTTTTTDAVAIVHVSTGSLRANSGRVTISEAGVGRLATGTISDGVARLHLPRFSIGQHNLTVSYAGTPYIAPTSVVHVERVALGH